MVTGDILGEAVSGALLGDILGEVVGVLQLGESVGGCVIPNTRQAQYTVRNLLQDCGNP